jgi:hypothetical protein
MTESQTKVLNSFVAEYYVKSKDNPKQFGMLFQNGVSILFALAGEPQNAQAFLKAHPVGLTTMNERPVGAVPMQTARRLTTEEILESSEDECIGCNKGKTKPVAIERSLSVMKVTNSVTPTAKTIIVETEETEEEFWAVIAEYATSFDGAKMMCEERYDMKIAGTVKTKEGLKKYITNQLA